MRRTLLLVILILTGCVDGENADPTPTLDLDDPLVQDAQMIADDLGIPLEEAVARIEVQDEIGELQAELQENEADTFGGLWIQHEPDYAVVVAFTENGEEALAPYIEGKSWGDLVEVQQVAHSYADLRAAQTEIFQSLQSLNISASGGVDIQENQVTITVGNPELALADLEEAGVEVPAFVSFEAIDPGNLPPTNQGGVETYTGPNGQTIYFPYGAPADAYMEALIEGELILDGNGCLHIGPMEQADESMLVIWRYGFSLNVDGETIEVLNENGQPVARVGEPIRAGGGGIGEDGPADSPLGIPIGDCQGPYWILGEIQPLADR